MRRAGMVVLALAGLFGAVPEAQAGPLGGQRFCSPNGRCGALLFLDEARFEPLLQRLLVERELLGKTERRPLLLVLPPATDPALAERQIRFLHELLVEGAPVAD